MELPESMDDLLRALGERPVADHDPARARRIRDRARVLLSRRRGALRRERPASSHARPWESALAGALSLGFAAWVVTRSIVVLHVARGGFFWR